jgi:hypothetical protein
MRKTHHQSSLPIAIFEANLVRAKIAGTDAIVAQLHEQVAGMLARERTSVEKQLVLERKRAAAGKS